MCDSVPYTLAILWDFCLLSSLAKVTKGTAGFVCLSGMILPGKSALFSAPFSSFGTSQDLASLAEDF